MSTNACSLAVSDRQIIPITEKPFDLVVLVLAVLPFSLIFPRLQPSFWNQFLTPNSPVAFLNAVGYPLVFALEPFKYFVTLSSHPHYPGSLVKQARDYTALPNFYALSI